MNDLEAFRAAEAAELAKAIERHGRLVKLAEQNGYRPNIVAVPHLEGMWWKVPIALQPLVGCMMARVA